MKRSFFCALFSSLCLSEAVLAAGPHNVRDFGAKGDGKANDTKAIQRAIDAGGTVYFPDGVYVTGTLYLRSNGGLELSSQAVLLASTDPADYCKKGDFPQETKSNVGPGNGSHLIVAHEVENVFIRGGKIDGNGRTFFKGCAFHERFTGGRLMVYPAWWVQQLLYFCECRNVRLTDISMEDSTCWNCFLHGCENVAVRGLHINSSPCIGQDDGLDIDCCRFVTVSDCIIFTGDDALTLRGCSSVLKEPRPCEWVTVSNCILKSHYAHAVRVGVGNGIIRHCSLNDLQITGGHCAIHINSKYSSHGDGVHISDLAFRNIRSDAEMFTSICLDYKKVEIPSRKSICNVTFSGVTGTMSLPSRIIGNTAGKVERICFRDIDLTVTGDNTPSERTMQFLMLTETPAPFLLAHTEGVEFQNVHLRYEHPEKWNGPAAETETAGTTFRDCRMNPNQ